MRAAGARCGRNGRGVTILSSDWLRLSSSIPTLICRPRSTTIWSLLRPELYCRIEWSFRRRLAKRARILWNRWTVRFGTHYKLTWSRRRSSSTRIMPALLLSVFATFPVSNKKLAAPLVELSSSICRTCRMESKPIWWTCFWVLSKWICAFTSALWPKQIRCFDKHVTSVEVFIDKSSRSRMFFNF